MVLCASKNLGGKGVSDGAVLGMERARLEARVPWLPILMYHRVVPRVEGPDPYHLKVSTDEFEAQMRYLSDRGYRSISFEELALMTIRGDRPRGKQVIITFDDGYRDVYYHAFPILRKYQMTATFFLVSSCISGFNVWDLGRAKVAPLLELEQLKEMRGHGMDFGSHGATHRPLTDLGADTARQEMLDSKATLEDWLEMEILSFSFPHGRSNSALRDWVREAGYLSACGIEQREHTLFNLSRVDVASCRGSRLFWRFKVSGVHYLLRRSRGLRTLKACMAKGKEVRRPDGGR